MTQVCFIDVETTGLHPDRHQIWEVALIIDGEGVRVGPITEKYGQARDGWVEYVWQFSITEAAADPFALNIGGYWERRSPTPVTAGELWSHVFRDLVGTRHIAGAVPSFDEERLRRLLERNGVLPRWHYHLIDVEALAVGYARASLCALDGADRAEADEMLRPPWDSGDVSRAVGVDPDQFDRHTALGDARWAKAIYEAVLG